MKKIESISKIFTEIVPFIDWFNSKDNLDISIYQRDASNWLNSLLERLDTYLFLLDHLANARTHAINGQWDPFLFPDSLLHPLFDTKHTNILLPFSTHISEILPFTKIQYFNYENTLVFSLSVPTPSKEEFTLFKPHSIPTFIKLADNETAAVYIQTQTAYVALSKNNQTYFLSPNDLT